MASTMRAYWISCVGTGLFGDSIENSTACISTSGGSFPALRRVWTLCQFSMAWFMAPSISGDDKMWL